jgi:HAD superfamily hydrolase (TIGR01509 family)
MIKAILFDFNGVIINDEPIQLEAYRKCLAEEGISLTDEEYYSCLGMDDVRFVQAAYGRAGKPLSDEAINSLIEKKSGIHRTLISDELPLFPGVVTFIKAASREFALGVVSMARRVEIEYVLKRANLWDMFSGIVSAEDVTACKPDPSCYQNAFLKLDEARRRNGGHSLAPKECLVIEDAPPGIISALGAGMRPLGITNTVSAAELRQAGAEVVSPSLSDWTTDAVRHVFSRQPATAAY